MSHGILILLS